MKTQRKGTNFKIEARLAEHAKLAAEFEANGMSPAAASAEAYGVIRARGAKQDEIDRLFGPDWPRYR